MKLPLIFKIGLLLNYTPLSKYLTHVSLSESIVWLIRGRPKLSSFSKEYTEYGGGGGQWPPYALLNVNYDALHFHTGSLKIDIFEVLFWEGVIKKEYSAYAFDKVDNYGRPLRATIRRGSPGMPNWYLNSPVFSNTCIRWLFVSATIMSSSIPRQNP